MTRIILLTILSLCLPAVHGLTCCQSLDALFRGQGKVSFPISAAYTLQNQFWSTTSELSPSCIFSPGSSQDVAKGVHLFSSRKCKFAVRSGGHTPIPGWADIDNGILVSLSNLNEIKYDARGNTVQLGTGSRWRDVYSVLDPYGVTVMGGRSADVGIGGFLTGGGFSYLSFANGWACDNVIAYEVVLASGKIVIATAKSNVDLFIALRGGTSNFGIVTTFSLRSYAISAINAGIAFYPETSIPALIQASYNYSINGANVDPKSHIIPAFVKIGATPAIGAFTLFRSEFVLLTSEPEVYKPFLAIPAIASTRSNRVGFSSIAAELGAGQPNGNRNRWADFSILANAELMQQIYDLMITESEPYQNITGFQTTMAMQAVSHGFVAASKARGGNVLGLNEGPERTVVVVSLLAVYKQATDDAAIKEYSKRLIMKAKALAKSKGLFDKYQYLNYADKGQDVIAGYGSANVAKLRNVKAKYDPQNVFGTLVPGGFKIST